METYTVTSKHQKPRTFTCPDAAEIWKAQTNGSVEVTELDDSSPIALTDRIGSEITHEDFEGVVFEINVELEDIDQGGLVVGRQYVLDSITINGVDIKKLNFSFEFETELEAHADQYLEELNN